MVPSFFFFPCLNSPKFHEFICIYKYFLSEMSISKRVIYKKRVMVLLDIHTVVSNGMHYLLSLDKI